MTENNVEVKFLKDINFYAEIYKRGKFTGEFFDFGPWDGHDLFGHLETLGFQEGYGFNDVFDPIYFMSYINSVKNTYIIDLSIHDLSEIIFIDSPVSMMMFLKEYFPEALCKVRNESE